MTRAATRVLVADDSPTMRGAVVALLREDPRIEVVGEAAHGLEAVELARKLAPDVITMDVLMPGLDGLGAATRIMHDAPARILVVSSIADDSRSSLSFRAMEAGALEVIAKPRAGCDAAALRAWGRALADSIILMSTIPLIRRRRPASTETPAPARRARIDVVGMAASTGGPPVLATILGALPRDFPAPVLVAQHIAEGFAPALARWLRTTTRLEVQIAGGQACAPGHVYVAPDLHDIEVDREGVILARRSAGGHCPSGDRLLTSLANVWGSRACGVVLTGMGDDGALGLREIHRTGGFTLAQDEATSVVFGMPRIAAELGAAQHVTSPEGIAAAILAMGRERTP